MFLYRGEGQNLEMSSFVVANQIITIRKFVFFSGFVVYIMSLSIKIKGP